MKKSFRNTSEFPAARPTLRRIAAGVMLSCAVATALPLAPAFAQGQ